MLQTVPIPINHACNRIESNYNVQHDRRQFLSCKKAGRGRRDGCDNFRSRRCRCHFTSSHLASRSLSDSFQMHCRKARRTRGQCESNIGKQFFSEKNFSAAFQDFGPHLGSHCCTPSFRAASPPFSPFVALYSPSTPVSAFPSPALILLLSCRPIFSVSPLNRARFSQ